MISRLSIGVLVVALLTLAGFQYQWIGQISVAERQRLEQSVRDSSNRFAGDFAGEIRSLANALDIRIGGVPDVSAIGGRYRTWAETTAYPDLLRKLYLVRPTFSGESNLYQVDLQNVDLQPIEWPPSLLPLQEYFRRDPPSLDRRFSNNAGRLIPQIEGTSAVVIQFGGGRPPDSQRGRGGSGPGPGPASGRGQSRGGLSDFGRSVPPPQTFPDRAEAWLIAELDDAVFTKQIFPTLLARDFPMTGDQTYRIAVVSRTAPLRTIFSTGNMWTAEDMASPDFAIDLYGLSGPSSGLSSIGGRGGPPRPGERGPIQAFTVGQNFRLLVKHESGSLEAAVSNLRLRNLAISFGILLVLGLGAGFVMISGQRARTLGRLQMEFAAGVSHELRTPLAVIQSAAHNLRAGVVKDREGIEEYATIVQKEARRLSGMVEQVMTYAETQSGRKRYDISPVDLNEVVDRALQNMAIPLSDANATVENRIDPSLPPAMADEAALTQCVQNLLNNALKYGSGNSSVQIEIESEVDSADSNIRISVIDHGSGVPPGDERHLFDPFRRGSNAATNTPGNGLGLHLVRSIMESQKGTVAYKRAPNGGACFTLTLPAARASA